MAPTRLDMGEGIEIKFAQKLAGNEKESRDKALRKLKKWIQLKSSPESSESAYTELELLKLWKGLFYCMWMSDKPLVQEQLAEELSQLVHLFPHRQDAITFCSTFFITMSREWHSIDVIRREKYMMLVRRVLRQTLSLLLPTDAGAGGDDVSISRLTALCESSFARREDPATLPLGLQLHLVEIFLEEVAKVGGGHLTPPRMAALLAPFIQVLKVSKQSTLRKTVTDSVFYHLMRQSDVGIAHEALINGEELPSDSDDESDGDEDAPGERVLDPRAGGVDVTLPQLQVDYAQLAEDLVSAGADQNVRQKNRAALYRLAQQFRDLSESKYPLTLKIPDHVDSDSDISDEDMEAAVLRLQSTKQQLNKDSRKNQKNQKRLRAETEEEEPQPKKKKKLKHKMLANGVIDTGDEMMAEAESAAPEEEEASEDPEEQSPARRKTLKERRRQKLKEKREVELAKQKKKKNRLEAKRAKLNGDAAEESGLVNGILSNGDHDMEEDEGTWKVEEDDGVASEETQESTTPVTASKKKKKKKKRVTEEDTPTTDSVPVSLDDTASPPKTKKKKKKALNESVDIEAPALTDVPSLSANTAIENGTSSPPQQKKKSKKKKSAASGEATAAEAAAAAVAPSGGASPATPRSTFDWSLGTEDNWDEPAPAPAPAPATAAALKPAGKAAKKPAAGAAQSQVAHFVPSRPVPAFVKLRTAKKGDKTARQETPTTPRTPGGTKKVIINLAENKAQGFKEHLITVRNSPQVPHNPHRQPTKGLLKPSPAPPVVKAGNRRSKAADFFGL